MITLNSPISQPRVITGYTINELIDYPSGKCVNANITVHFQDESEQQRTLELWKDSPADLAYSDAGQWTDADAQARILELLQS